MQRVVVAKVIVDVPSKTVDRPFDYLVPDAFHDRIAAGWRVYVPFGKRSCQGYVMGVEDLTESPVRLKSIYALLGDEAALTGDLLELVAWMRARYVCTYLEAISSMVPSAFRVHKVARWVTRLTPGAGASPEQQRVWRTLAERPRSFDQLTAQFGPDVMVHIEQMRSYGWIEEVYSAEDDTKAKTVTWLESGIDLLSLTEEIEKRTRRAPKQAHLLRLLGQEHRVQLALHQIRPSDKAVQALVQGGLARLVEEEVYRTPQQAMVTPLAGTRILTAHQAAALNTILSVREAAGGAGVLLFGVTGSGKTEVYLQVIAQTIEQNGCAIVLVPEISLTPQMVGRFTQFFGNRVAVLHSGLSDGEKRDEWLRIRRGEAQIVIGARSAVFAPVANLKLVIVDEEHEPSYKQEENPRYEAREIARWRAERRRGIVIFGSATPSISTMVDVERGKNTLVTLPSRVHGKPLPPVTIVDMRDELRAGNRGLFSRALVAGLESAVYAGAQAVLFLNRRGYAAFMLCRSCGETLLCPHCDISLTVHKGRHNDFMECHYCGFHGEVPEICPTCGEAAVRAFGIGTQQVEQHLAERWPNWRVLRMDVDTTRRKGAHQQVIQSFLNHDADILLGTQMVAKGLDFPNVAFVGVVTADTMLAVPDYRAAERTFNLLTQVSGRSGRAEVAGTTVIQTYQPDNFAIVSAASHDYHGFYQREKALRQAFTYPPYCELAVFLATHTVEDYARGAAERFERELKRRALEGLTVLHAVPSGIKRVEDRFRYQVVVKYERWSLVQETVAFAYYLVEEKMRKLGGTCILDVNAGRI